MGQWRKDDLKIISTEGQSVTYRVSNSVINRAQSIFRNTLLLIGIYTYTHKIIEEYSKHYNFHMTQI